MMRIQLNVLLLVMTLVAKSCQGSSVSLSVVWREETNNYQVIPGQQSGVAWATFDNSINKTGWAYLEVYTNGSYDDIKQAYAAGFVEGQITKELTAMHWRNTYDGYCKKPLSPYCQRLQNYVTRNMAWIAEQIATKADIDPYWHQIEMVMEQQAGLVDGFSGMPRFPSRYTTDVTGLLLLQISGDLEDLEPALNKPGGHSVLGSGRCSALVKLLPGNSDLYVSQDTWTGFNTLLRILKKYDFQFHLLPDKAPIPAQVMTFSSYPGTIYSGDDFYIMPTGLVSIETTFGNSNTALWKYISPEGSVLEYVRNIVANRLATNGQEWTQYFSRHNSGTYNNEWMIVDYKAFKPGQDPHPGLLYVLEQLPGQIVAKDMTDFLKKTTYWASYNAAFFPEIFKAGGFPAAEKKYGDWFSYDHTPRANIFRRDHSKVKDIASMTKLMRYNDFTHDPLSRCNCTPPYSGENGISARSDLNPSNGTYPFHALGHRAHGGIDMKLTNSDMAKSLQFIAISSPAYDDVPPFQWSKSDLKDTVSHIGHPDLWTFKPVQHAWGERSRK